MAEQPGIVDLIQAAERSAGCELLADNGRERFIDHAVREGLSKAEVLEEIANFFFERDS